MATIGYVHFSIDFEWLTDHIRALWAEGRYKNALDLLDSSNCPKDQHKAILLGKLKMVGIDQGVLAADDWIPPAGYADPDNLREMAEEGMRYKKRYFELLRTNYFDLCEKWKDGKDLVVIEALFRQFPEEFAMTLNPIDRTPWNLAWRYHLVPAGATAMGGFVPSVEEFVAHQMELDKREAPDPDPDFFADYGWLLPNGKFYPCEYWEHDWLANVLEYSVERAEKAGWIRVGKSRITEEWALTRGDNAPEITQAQIDGLWEWCQNHHCDFPSWAQE